MTPATVATHDTTSKAIAAVFRGDVDHPRSGNYTLCIVCDK